MKSQVRPTGPASYLTDSSWARFSPDDRHAGLGERPELLDGDVLHGGQDLDLVRIPTDVGDRVTRTRRRFVRTSSGLSPWTSSTTPVPSQPRDPGLAAGDAPVAPM